jgi:hypothetical protein
MYKLRLARKNMPAVNRKAATTTRLASTVPLMMRVFFHFGLGGPGTSASLRQKGLTICRARRMMRLKTKKADAVGPTYATPYPGSTNNSARGGAMRTTRAEVITRTMKAFSNRCRRMAVLSLAWGILPATSEVRADALPVVVISMIPKKTKLVTTIRAIIIDEDSST